MKRIVLPLALLSMAALIGAAMAWDCVRLAADARRRVLLADQEMQKHELRLTKRLSGLPTLSQAIQASINIHRRAANPLARHEAYEELVATLHKDMTSDIDPTNPIDRKFMDDIAGAINRREIAQKEYEKELAVYQQFLSSVRGRVAQRFSSRARHDAKPGA